MTYKEILMKLRTPMLALAAIGTLALSACSHSGALGEATDCVNVYHGGANSGRAADNQLMEGQAAAENATILRPGAAGQVAGDAILAKNTVLFSEVMDGTIDTVRAARQRCPAPKYQTQAPRG